MDWHVDKSRDIYNTAQWSGGYFDIGVAGTMIARPNRSENGPSIDLYALAAELQQAGLRLPVLVRFIDILHDRVDTLRGAFAGAMQVEGYRGSYTAVYPIKVNQHRRVVEEIVARGNGGVGLEAGSKPELMAVLALAPAGGTIVCNGYKDREYIRLALIGRRLGLRIFIVVEKPSELAWILSEAQRLQVEPLIGIRVRLASIGGGKWQNTGGEKSKFGLSASQALDAVQRLVAAGKAQSLKLLHVHLGSQISNVRDIQRGMREIARYYSELHRLGIEIHCVDVGGGLGVDYEGTHSRSFCSINYTVQEYANNVVHALWDVCQEQGLPHPDIITESGRAMTAHHAVLITNVIDIERVPEANEVPEPVEEDPQILHDMLDTLRGVRPRTALEAYHDAYHWLGETHAMYNAGVLSLEQRARGERLYHAICRKVLQHLDPAAKAHREALDDLNEKLADKLFCNFSLFQSMPDVWAIDQIFPIVPLHRLDEEPTRRVVLEDLTCDSDGSVELYVDGEGIESTLPLPPYRPGEPFLLGMFMVGAYQEILGDLHNLFGDTDSVNLELTADGGYRLTGAVQGDTVEGVLRFVTFDAQELLDAYRRKVEGADLSVSERKAFMSDLQAGLGGYTYLED